MMTVLLMVLFAIVALGFLGACVLVGLEAAKNPFLLVWWYCLGGLESTAKVAGVVLLAIGEAIAESTK